MPWSINQCFLINSRFCWCLFGVRKCFTYYHGNYSMLIFKHTIYTWILTIWFQISKFWAKWLKCFCCCWYISAKQTIISHLKPLNTKKTTKSPFLDWNWYQNVAMLIVIVSLFMVNNFSSYFWWNLLSSALQLCGCLVSYIITNVPPNSYQE